MTHEVAACYTLAIRGWAQFMSSPPRMTDGQSDAHAAWECYGAILFWMHQAGLSDKDLDDNVEPHWRRLRSELLSAAADPLCWLAHSSRIRFDDGTSVIGRLMRTFSDQIRPLLEWSLEHLDVLVSVFSGFITQDLGSYIINMLSSTGDAETVELLRAYVDDSVLGRSAIGAIKQLTAGRT